MQVANISMWYHACDQLKQSFDEDENMDCKELHLSEDSGIFHLISIKTIIKSKVETVCIFSA